jgi:CheY-like chemotaxis protein
MAAQTLCEMFGCTSESVEDGAAAVEAAATGRFGLVLMDVKMPGMDGVEATRRIRAGRSVGSQVPILAVTANADRADAAFYRSCGMNGVVEKPVKPERLLEAMSAVLQAPIAAAEEVAAAWPSSSPEPKSSVEGAQISKLKDRGFAPPQSRRVSTSIHLPIVVATVEGRFSAARTGVRCRRA